MKLSIIIPVYNAERFIARCLDSILCQGLDPSIYEVIVVNDGSTDRSGQIVQQYTDANPNIKQICRKNHGQSITRNIGIDAAAGEWIQFVDADDELFPNLLPRLLPLTDRDDVDVITFRFLRSTFKDEKLSEGSLHEEFSVKSYSSGYDFISANNYSNGPWWYLCRRELMTRNELKFVPGKYSEDAMFTMKMFLSASGVLETDILGYWYIVRPSGIISSQNASHLQAMINSFEYVANYLTDLIEKHRDRMPESCLMRCIERRDSFIFLMLIRMMKAKVDNKQITETLQRLKAKGRYPFPHMRRDYSAIHLRVIHYILNRPLLYKMCCRTYALLVK